MGYRPRKNASVTKRLTAAIKAYDRNGYGCGEYIDTLRSVPERLKSIKAAAEAVGDNWEQGDLAGAVHDLLCEVADL